MAGWLLLLTSLDDHLWPLEQVLLLYRARWQIELLFKRIKQLARLHRLASDHPATNEAVLAILLLGWALVEQQALPWRQSLHEQACNQQSPGEQATLIHPVSSWQVYALLIHLLRSAIVGMYAWKACGNPNVLLGRFLTSHPQQRIQQESVLCQVLATNLAGIA